MSQTQTLTAMPRTAPSAARLFLNLLSYLQSGHLQLITPDGNRLMFGDMHQPPSATLQINDWRACARIIRAGDIGFAESYADNWIATPDLASLLRLAIRNEAVLNRMVFGGPLAKLWYRLHHWLRPNTRNGSRRNIHAHYDIGNDFYRLWLDPSLTYSSAIFDGDYTLSLYDAQIKKYQRIIDKLGLRAGDRVLEIGCGWGGFAEYAGLLGIHVDGVTISSSQLEIAKQRIAQQHIQHRVDLQLRDYRDLDSQYDAVVSIEMFEAVGERFWNEYFTTVCARLKPNGKALIQSITIAEPYFERYRSNTDFIQQYIFPGGMLPSPERFCQHASDAGLHTTEQYAFGQDYAETLRRWHNACEHKSDAIAKQGFDERFIRIWRLYLNYCEAGFDEGRTNVVQFLLHRA
ncbi:SAM-dependent methyltransferase [Glaciimonas soli]|uniref:Methyltransferase domain-containing protein n=1 Tax=Glaciimonas soli TaxID=2590999 RepID=A0A843YQF3_9BURK|nr:cyclopropane-fatty-acyl-phospholipid synthase family protein [Glaciimonas soli]MQQ99752.1 methyltransferase domain-containing protein [Glaciimonas soli]